MAHKRYELRRISSKRREKKSSHYDRIENLKNLRAVGAMRDNIDYLSSGFVLRSSTFPLSVLLKMKM